MRALEDAELLLPATLSEALALLGGEATRGTLLAGGTDLMVQWEAGLKPPGRVVNIKGLPELQGIREAGALLDIGAGVTHAQLRYSALVRAHAPSLAEAAATVGGAQIQALGTIGGSIANASPAGDLAPSLLVADATVVLASARGERRVGFRNFLLGYRKIDLKPDELIIRFLIPKKAAGQREGWRKLGPRAAQAISKVMGSYRGEAAGARVVSFAVAVGSVAPTAIRLAALEEWLRGRVVDAATLDEAERRAAAEVKPIDDIRSTAAYRKWVTGRIVRSFVETIINIG